MPSSKRIFLFAVSLSTLVILVANVWLEAKARVPRGRARNAPEAPTSVDRPEAVAAFDLSPQRAADERSLPWYRRRAFAKVRTLNFTYDDLWPGANESDDRIARQLLYAPDTSGEALKKVYVSSLRSFDMDVTYNAFKEARCPVQNCAFTSSMADADAVVFKDKLKKGRRTAPPNQIWVLFLLENPYNCGNIVPRSSVNWTASYRRDSELVTPYAKWVYYDESVRRGEFPPSVNYAFGKTKLVAWFVSNCRSTNMRMEYANELKKHITVDVYGTCGTFSCPKTKPRFCFKMLSRMYKFYLSFENGNCVDYITEKFYENGLRNEIIPIVMGARKEDYAKVAPEHSYIHVEDFEDAKSLADYLHVLDRNDTLYNSYFAWKTTGEFIHTYFFCRLCALLNSRYPTRTYDSFNGWWNKAGTCVRDRWDRVGRASNRTTPHDSHARQRT